GASVLCATATSLSEMIVYRAIQGFFGGAMTPTVWPVVYTKFHGSAGKRHLDYLGNTQLGFDTGPDTRRVFDGYLFLALALPGQHRPRLGDRRGGVGYDRYRQARPVAPARFRSGRDRKSTRLNSSHS